jgi:hypothetical protein
METDTDIIERLRAEFAEVWRREVRRAVSCLANDLRPVFAGATLDSASKALVSQCGRHRLQWKPVANKRRGFVDYATAN